MDSLNEFENLTPDAVLNAIEDVYDCRLNGVTLTMPSYINRVYEVQTVGGERLIAKFYRPGRWTKATIEDEHDFMNECAREDIPVVAPFQLKNGSTLGESENIYMAVYPKMGGRRFEITDEDCWGRLGSLIGRIHAVGAQGDAANRLKLHPDTLTRQELDFLLKGDFIGRAYRKEFKELSNKILSTITSRFDDFDYIRIHADCHFGNILDRMEQGLIMIDFDDMMTGPPIQDLWLVLPDHINKCTNEFDMMLEGYEQFSDFDDMSQCLVEPLRIMRILYFLSWCARQSGDFKFQHNFPDWGTDSFWRREINDLTYQLNVINEDDKRRSKFYNF